MSWLDSITDSLDIYLSKLWERVEDGGDWCTAVTQRALCNHGVGLNLVTEQKQQSIYVIKAEFRKGRGTRDQIANIHWTIEKAREFQKNINFCFIDYTKAFDCVNHSKLWKILQEMGIPDHLTCLLRNLYAG